MQYIDQFYDAYCHQNSDAFHNIPDSQNSTLFNPFDTDEFDNESQHVTFHSPHEESLSGTLKQKELNFEGQQSRPPPPPTQTINIGNLRDDHPLNNAIAQRTILGLPFTDEELQKLEQRLINNNNQEKINKTQTTIISQPSLNGSNIQGGYAKTKKRMNEEINRDSVSAITSEAHIAPTIYNNGRDYPNKKSKKTSKLNLSKQQQGQSGVTQVEKRGPGRKPGIPNAMSKAAKKQLEDELKTCKDALEKRMIEIGQLQRFAFEADANIKALTGRIQELLTELDTVKMELKTTKETMSKTIKSCVNTEKERLLKEYQQKAALMANNSIPSQSTIVNNNNNGFPSSSSFNIPTQQGYTQVPISSIELVDRSTKDQSKMVSILKEMNFGELAQQNRKLVEENRLQSSLLFRLAMSAGNNVPKNLLDEVYEIFNTSDRNNHNRNNNNNNQEHVVIIQPPVLPSNQNLVQPYINSRAEPVIQEMNTPQTQSGGVEFNIEYKQMRGIRSSSSLSPSVSSHSRNTPLSLFANDSYQPNTDINSCNSICEDNNLPFCPNCELCHIEEKWNSQEHRSCTYCWNRNGFHVFNDDVLHTTFSEYKDYTGSSL